MPQQLRRQSALLLAAALFGIVQAQLSPEQNDAFDCISTFVDQLRCGFVQGGDEKRIAFGECLDVLLMGGELDNLEGAFNRLSDDVQHPKLGCSKSSSHRALIIGSGLLLVTLAFVILGAVRSYLAGKTRQVQSVEGTKEDVLQQQLVSIVRQFSLVRSPRWLKDESIKLQERIGQGAFGEVYQGILYDDTIRAAYLSTKKSTSHRSNQSHASGPHSRAHEHTVAVKVLTAGADTAAVEAVLMETAILAQFDHPHVVSLIGIAVSELPMVAMELCQRGSLHAMLTSDSLYQVFTLGAKLKAVVDIACGMKYIASNRFVHRDLAARNILVNQDYVFKVADFGLTKYLEGNDAYSVPEYLVAKEQLPLRWTAVEALRKKTFSEASDVWSFGVVVWEIFARGCKPYKTMNNSEVWVAVREGLRLHCPPGCPEEVYMVMVSCWQEDPADRPSFESLWSYFDDMIHIHNTHGPLVKRRLTVRHGSALDDGHKMYETTLDPSVQNWHAPAPRHVSMLGSEAHGYLKQYLGPTAHSKLEALSMLREPDLGTRDCPSAFYATSARSTSPRASVATASTASYVSENASHSNAEMSLSTSDEDGSSRTTCNVNNLSSQSNIVMGFEGVPTNDSTLERNGSGVSVTVHEEQRDPLNVHDILPTPSHELQRKYSVELKSLGISEMARINVRKFLMAVTGHELQLLGGSHDESAVGQIRETHRSMSGKDIDTRSNPVHNYEYDCQVSPPRTKGDIASVRMEKSVISTEIISSGEPSISVIKSSQV